MQARKSGDRDAVLVGNAAVHRFLHKQSLIPAYASRKGDLEGSPDEWMRAPKFDGVAFWTYPEDQPGTRAVYHFWFPTLERHSYTIDPIESNDKREDENWEEQPIAWYAYDWAKPEIP